MYFKTNTSCFASLVTVFVVDKKPNELSRKVLASYSTYGSTLLLSGHLLG